MVIVANKAANSPADYEALNFLSYSGGDVTGCADAGLDHPVRCSEIPPRNRAKFPTPIRADSRARVEGST